MNDYTTSIKRPARPHPIGNGLYRSSEMHTHNWSNDWPFRAQRNSAGPTETFAVEAGKQVRRARQPENSKHQG